MHTNSFIIQIKPADFYKEIADDVKDRFGKWNYSKDEDRPFPYPFSGKIMICRTWTKNIIISYKWL